MLQSVLVELQKQTSPPGSVPTPRHDPCQEHGGQSLLPLDLIVGGWKEGRTKESVKVELGGKLIASEVQLRALILFGKKPTMGRIELDFPADADLPT